MDHGGATRNWTSCLLLILSCCLLCKEPAAGLLADVEHRLAAALEQQKKVNQLVAVHHSLWEQAKQFTKSIRAVT